MWIIYLFLNKENKISIKRQIRFCFCLDFYFGRMDR